MHVRGKEPWRQCYEVLSACNGDGLTASDLHERCNLRYGTRYSGYWGRQLQALADMGYAQKSGRWFKNAPIWVALAPDEQQ